MSRVRTHCGNGHALTPENIYVTPKGRIDCRTCRREAKRVRKAPVRFEAVKRYLRIPVPGNEPYGDFIGRARLKHEVPSWARVVRHGAAVTFDWYETREMAA